VARRQPLLYDPTADAAASVRGGDCGTTATSERLHRWVPKGTTHRLKHGG